jgi:rod shape-determining protein MreC
VISFIKRYRELLAIGALLLLPLITYLAYAKKAKGRPLNAFDRAVVWVSAPLQRSVTGIGFGIVDAWQNYVSLRHVHDENLALHREVLRLREQVARDEEARAENDRLRKDLAYAEAAPAPAVVAPVVGWSPKAEYLSLMIGKGSADGIQPGMAVVVPDGVVGRVNEAFSKAAIVILLGDPRLLVPVRIQRSRARATVRGKGERQPCQLIRAVRTDDIEDGDIAVTEGVEVFPKGLVVGKVRNVARPKFGLFQTADVAPAVDVSKVEEVLVLLQPATNQPEARSIAP